MKTTFACSLICNNGIIGGKICVEDESVVYKTNKLTVDKKYRNLSLPFDSLRGISWKRIIFPIATFKTFNGEQYKFIIFRKNKFDACYTVKKELFIFMQKKRLPKNL